METKKRFGRQLRIDLTATIIESGLTRKVLFSYPSHGNFERPLQVLFNFTAWLFANFPNLESFDCVRAALWVDEKEKNSARAKQKVMDYIKDGMEKEKGGCEING